MSGKPSAQETTRPKYKQAATPAAAIMPDRNAQNQRAGENAQQVQAARDVTIINIHTSADAMQYLDESRRQLLAQELAASALEIASQRVAAYDKQLTARLDSDENLESLGDPAFQLAVNKSRMTAGATERPADADRLIELMAQRAARTDRLVRAAVDRAVDVVDDVDESALAGLSLYLGAMQAMPNNIVLGLFLDEWESVIARILPASLPGGTAWLEHLHVIGAIRIDTSGAQTLRPTAEWLEAARPGFFTPGVAVADLPALLQACSPFLESVPLAVMPHELREGFFRPMVGTAVQMELVLKTQNVQADRIPNVILELKNRAGLDSTETSLRPALESLLQSKPSLTSYFQWRGQLPYPVHSTMLGKALAWAYLKRLDAITIEFDAFLQSV